MTDSPKNALFIVLSIVVVIAIVIGGFLWMNTSRSRSVMNCQDKLNTPEVTIAYTGAQQFAESCVKVTGGTKIIYRNDSSEELQVGADPHPIHTGNKELTNGQFTLNVKPGETASVIVSTKGTFGVHNHLNSGSGTTIVVE